MKQNLLTALFVVLTGLGSWGLISIVSQGTAIAKVATQVDLLERQYKRIEDKLDVLIIRNTR